MERNVMGEPNVYRGGPARSRTSARSRGGTAWTGTRSPSTGGMASPPSTGGPRGAAPSTRSRRSLSELYDEGRSAGSAGRSTGRCWRRR